MNKTKIWKRLKGLPQSEQVGFFACIGTLILVGVSTALGTFHWTYFDLFFSGIMFLLVLNTVWRLIKP